MFDLENYEEDSIGRTWVWVRTVIILMYFILPLWLVTGFADSFCHRASHIETKSGAKDLFRAAARESIPKSTPLRRAERGLRRLSQDVVSSNNPARRSKRCSRSKI